MQPPYFIVVGGVRMAGDQQQQNADGRTTVTGRSESQHRLASEVSLKYNKNK